MRLSSQHPIMLAPADRRRQGRIVPRAGAFAAAACAAPPVSGASSKRSTSHPSPSANHRRLVASSANARYTRWGGTG
jgi:hypothetical protein